MADNIEVPINAPACCRIEYDINVSYSEDPTLLDRLNKLNGENIGVTSSAKIAAALDSKAAIAEAVSAQGVEIARERREMASPYASSTMTERCLKLIMSTKEKMPPLRKYQSMNCCRSSNGIILIPIFKGRPIPEQSTPRRTVQVISLYICTLTIRPSDVRMLLKMEQP